MVEPEQRLPPEIRSITRDGVLEDDPLREWFVWWDDVTQADAEACLRVLDTAPDEKPLQQHLTAHPMLLVQFCRGGHGRWVIPQKRLGAEFVPDFVIADRDSGGIRWTLVELQSPVPRRTRSADSLFLANGRPCEQLDEGVRQIRRWRTWIKENLDYAPFTWRS